MKLVDANVLLYSVNQDAPHHEESRGWLDEALSGQATVAFAWLPLLAFVRLSTKVDLFPAPLSVEAAFSRVDGWLAQPSAVVVEPTERHAALVRDMLVGARVGGNLVNDAHLAALAIEHRCEVVSYDRDFARFDGIDWETPQARS